jgi:hypothetical protein
MEMKSRSLPSWLAMTAVLASLLAGCGGSTAHVRLTPARHAQVVARVKRVAYLFSQPRPVPSASARSSRPGARRSADPSTEPGDWHPNPPEVPSAGGKLRATFRATLHGGTWVSPAGHPGATGRAVVRLYGATEVCWRFSDLHGFYRRTGMGLFMGNVAPDVGKVWTPEVKLGAGFRASGCQTGIPSTALRPIEAQPDRYFVGISDIEYAVAAGGQL